MLESLLNASANLEVSFPTLSHKKRMDSTLDSTFDYKDNEDHEVSFWADEQQRQQEKRAVLDQLQL